MKKVLVVSSAYPSRESPVDNIFVQDQVRVLSTRYDVSVIVPSQINVRELVPGRSQRRHAVPVQEILEGVPVYRYRGFTALGRFEVLAHRGYVRGAQESFEQLRRTWGNPDIVHAHTIFPGGWAAMNLSRSDAVPFVLTEHSAPFSVHINSWARGQKVKQVLEAASHVLAVGPRLADTIKDFCPGTSISVLPNVIDTNFFVPADSLREQSQGNGTVFLTVALLDDVDRKGITHLLRAVEILVRRGMTAFRVLIGGDGQARHSLEEFADSLGISSHVEFLGMLDRYQVRAFMQRCDVFVLPSLHETFGLVVAEAMACGKPVIATRSGGPEYVVNPGAGQLIPVADSTRLADAMRALASDHTTYDSKMIRRSIVTRFGPDTFLSNISEVYESVWNSA